MAKKRVLPATWAKKEVKTEHHTFYAEPTAPPPPPSKQTFETASLDPPRVYLPPKQEDSEADAKVASIFLSNEQQQILKLVESGSNVFFTGSAGMSLAFKD